MLGLVQAGPADEVDDFIRGEMERQNIPGLSLAVVRHGENVKAAGYGLADRRLGLEDSIGPYLGDAPTAWEGITIRHLLTHTAGLVREAPGFTYSRAQSDADVIRSARDSPLRFMPGEKWEYSNLGYFMLAEIIRVVSGRPWTEFLQAEVFTPSGMRATWPTNTTERVLDLAQGYVDNDELRDAPHVQALRPSGAFLSTVLDLAAWDAMLYADRVLTASSRRQMWTPVTLSDGTSHPYGFGWQIADVRGHRMVFHHGGMPGARSTMARFVDEGLTIVILMNLNDADVGAILNGVASFYLPAPNSNASRSTALSQPVNGWKAAGAPWRR
ncbi:serine hydrolase domain-containing protein [Candidatus Palauibacter sp.]|uniref:serine hydrolase domain-containing protein n=1 Tax=Candidatus Palauibacter sp. TaxID=3101350 RepID=UPI003AF3031F